MSSNPLQLLQKWSGSNVSALQGMTAPILVVAILGLMVLPVPPWLLDTFGRIFAPQWFGAMGNTLANMLVYIIMAVAAVSPIVAQLIPGKFIPQTVLLLAAGTALGPYGLGVIEVNDAVKLLSELGMAFLFLLAGYEIDPKRLAGHQGKVGLLTWGITLGLAWLVVTFLPFFTKQGINGVATVIALTTTALGTLMPILKERNLEGTPIGDAIISYGTWGELGPILAMAILLSTRTGWQTMLVLGAFLAICLLCAMLPTKALKTGHRLYRFLTENANTSSQTLMRLTTFLLIFLVTISALFELDAVLGAFAAGFILRYIIPDGSKSILEGAITATGWASIRSDGISRMYFEALSKKYRFSLTQPYDSLSDEVKNVILYGTGGEKLELHYDQPRGKGVLYQAFEGICNNLERRYQETQSDASKRELEELMAECPCPTCKGR